MCQIISVREPGFWDQVTKLVSAPLRTAASWSRKIMSRQLENYGINILQLHAEWLLANGYKLQAKSCKRQIRMILKKRQASSLTAGPGYDRMNLERNNYGHNTIEKNSRRFGGDTSTSKTGYAKV